MPAVKTRPKARHVVLEAVPEAKPKAVLHFPRPGLKSPALAGAPPAKAKPSTKWLFFLAGTYVLCRLALSAFADGLVGRGLVYSVLELALVSTFFPWQKFKGMKTHWLLLLGLGLMAYGLLSMPSFGMALGPDHPFDFQVYSEHPWILILMGAFCLYVGLGTLPAEGVAVTGLSSIPARFVFWAILAVAAWLRLCNLKEPFPFYWDDYVLAMVDGRGVLDFGENHMLFATGDRQPFYNYLVVLVYALFPHWTSTVVQNVTWAAIDLAGIWVLYLLGKEVGGRRVGLMVAGLGAVSKPILTGCLTDQPLVTTPLSVAVALLFTFRVFKKPDLRHFLQWGVAIAFGAYCYQTGRPYIWLLPMAALAFVFFRKDERQTGWRTWFLAGGGVLAWSLGFLYVNRFLPLDNPFVKVISSPWVPEAIGFILLYTAVTLKNEDAPGKPKSLTAYWALGLFFALALMFPIIREPNFANHASQVSIFHHEGRFDADWSIVPVVFHKFGDTLKTVFETGPDRMDMGLPYEAFFEFQGVLVALLGLVFLLVRPNWTKAFLGLCAFIALIPHVFSIDPHSGKLLGLVAPVFLLGSLAMDRILRELSALRWGRLWGGAGTLLILGLWAWNGWDMYQRFYVTIPARSNNDVIVHNEVEADALKTRTYLFSKGNFFSFSTQGILDEGYDVYVLDAGSNPIDLAPGDKKTDVVVLLPGTAGDMIARIRREYPASQWSETRAYYQPATDAAFLKRAFIPAGSIPAVPAGVKPPAKLLYFRETPSPVSWRQRLYATRVGLGKGLIQWEGKVGDPLKPVPGAVGTQTASVEGIFKAPVSGRYTFSAKAGNYVVLSIGGKKILDSRPRLQVVDASAKTYLKAGTYPITLLTYFQVNMETPALQIQFPGEKTKRLLGSWQ